MVVVFVCSDEVKSVLQCVEVVECSFGDDVGCCICCAWGEGREAKEAEGVVVGVLDLLLRAAVAGAIRCHGGQDGLVYSIHDEGSP